MANTAVALVNKIKGDLELTRPSFEEINLNNLSFAKELEFAIQIIAGNDYLAKMDSTSITNCLVNIALSGLTLNPIMKLAYLVPRKGKCCVDPSYQGLVKIVTDTGSVKSIRANVVYEKDTFDIQLGSDGYVVHKPFLGAGSCGKVIGAYSLAILNDGSDHIDWMKYESIVAIMNRSESVKAQKSSPWDTDWDEMAKKTVVKRHFKYLPKSERAIMAAQAIDLDNQINGIDFTEEKKPVTTLPKATPNAPETALATDEDLAILFEWLDSPELPDLIFGGIKKTAMKAAIQKKFDNNKLDKDKAEEYIKGLEEEVKKASV